VRPHSLQQNLSPSLFKQQTHGGSCFLFLARNKGLMFFWAGMRPELLLQLLLDSSLMKSRSSDRSWSLASTLSSSIKSMLS
jgi:hypothetical protein